MTASNDRKRAAVMRLVRKGLLTPNEAADFTSTPRDLVEYWALVEGIDVNRLPNLTLDRRPILTLLNDGFGR